MDIEYQTYVPMPLGPGSETNIGSVKWICVKPCTLIGYTLEEGLPVIQGPDGPIMSDHHFIQASYFKTMPKPGQSYIEIMALRGYKRITPEELVGKGVRYSHCGYDSIIVVCTDNSYFKLVTERDRYDDDVSLAKKDLTISDLRLIGAISDEDFSAYQEECEANHKRVKEADDIRRFRLAAQQVGLGVAKVEELLNG